MRCAAWAVVGACLVALAGCGGGGGGGGDGGDDPPAAVFQTFQDATTVIGQAGFSIKDRNRDGSFTATGKGFHAPVGICVHGGTLLVADSMNHRALCFESAPFANDPTATFVVGQPDFASSSFGLFTNRLFNPRAVCMHAGGVVLSDTENNRVLIWNSVPRSDEGADLVLGQGTFTTNDAGVGPGRMDHPAEVAVAGGRLILADRGNNRVLVWNTFPTGTAASADLVLGQTTFGGSSYATSATRMRGPAAVWSDGTRLIVADSGNHRVLIWSPFPTTNGEAASVVVGQADFTSNAGQAGAAGLAFPTGLASDGTRLVVADYSNYRVLVYDEIPTENGAAADVVLGQSDFEHTTPNDDDQDGVEDEDPTARVFGGPGSVAMHGGRLYVSDFWNNRVVVFEPRPR